MILRKRAEEAERVVSAAGRFWIYAKERYPVRVISREWDTKRGEWYSIYEYLTHGVDDGCTHGGEKKES